jgi:hypothetical protein
MRPKVLLLLVLFVGACRVLGPDAIIMQVGAPEPPRPKNCSVRFEQLTPHEADERYRQVGTICFWDRSELTNLPANPQSWSERDQRELAERVCGLGGEVFIVARACAPSTVEYAVYTSQPQRSK